MSLQGGIDADDRCSTEGNGNGSRFNAVTHGLTAKTAVLPGEQAGDYQALIDGIKASLETRNELEDALAEQAALAYWQLGRAGRAETARISRDLLTWSAADALRAAMEATALGNRLFHDRRGPIEIYPSRDYDYKQDRTSWSPDAKDPDHPALLVLQLEATLAGCRWMLDRWGELRGVLESGMGWQSHEKIKVIRLMGKQPVSAVGVREVAQVFLACHVIEPQFPYAFQELRCDMHEGRFKIHKVLLERWKDQGITPANPAAARAALLGIVDKATERLRMLEANHQKVADAVNALQTRIKSHDESKAGDQIRRHQGSCNRLVLRNLEAIQKARRDEASGWGRTRQERDRRKQNGGKTGPYDGRLVADRHGTVRNAEGYKGNLEEGLARYEADYGKQPSESQPEIEETYVRAMPDFSRWKPPVVEPERPRDEGQVGAVSLEADQEMRDDRGGVMDQIVEGEAGFGDGAGWSGMEPLMVAETGERANLQNENFDDGLGMGEVPTTNDGGAETSGQGDGGDPSGARDPRRMETDGGEASGAREPVRTQGLSKREKRRQRRELAQRELERVAEEVQPEEDVPLEEVIESIEWMLPNIAAVLRAHLPRSP